MSIALAANNDLITESVYGNRFLFQGREYDYDTALYYFRARWYEPETGRWLSPDPIGISGGLNLYTFCGNDPVNFVDPTGNGGVQFGDWFLGWGNPWLVFDASTIGEIGRGTAATIDGFTPFFDPFCDYLGVYSKNDKEYEISRKAGKIARVFAGEAIPLSRPVKMGITLINGTINAITFDDDFFEEQKGQ
ncbi:MAG: RHS repeat-associated core domain-containing protein [Verrucomicrobia bacterium]|nr:RHS repeat-associated core domain-containing protein [Verrucomicrobiota bacterium]